MAFHQLSREKKSGSTLNEPQTVQMKGKAASTSQITKNTVMMMLSGSGRLWVIDASDISDRLVVEFAPGADQHRREQDDDAEDGQHRRGSGRAEKLRVPAEVV